MRHVDMLIAMSAMVLVAAGSARGSTSPGPLLLDSTAVTSSELSLLPVMTGEASVSKTIFLPARYSTIGQHFVATSATDDKTDKKNPPAPPPPPPPPDPPKSKSCPPAPGDDPRDANCGKGNDGKLP